ncbi:MAG: hypothetical protein ACJAWS_003110, partial [Oleiphilaceae bacterium]
SVLRSEVVLLTQAMFKGLIKRLGLNESDFRRILVKDPPLEGGNF